MFCTRIGVKTVRDSSVVIGFASAFLHCKIVVHEFPFERHLRRRRGGGIGRAARWRAVRVVDMLHMGVVRVDGGRGRGDAIFRLAVVRSRPKMVSESLSNALMRKRGLRENQSEQIRCLLP